MTTTPEVAAVVRPHAEQAFADELTALGKPTTGPGRRSGRYPRTP